MMAMKSQYPEGMPWTNDNCYNWKGGNVIGCGCAGFAIILSDACFGEIKAKQIKPCSGEYKVGDIVRINNDGHSVIILKTESSLNKITIAEGNYNSKIHWGRTFTYENLQNACYYIYRRTPS